MLEIKDLTVEVGGRTVLKDVNLTVASGSTSVLFGPNGSGKSSLLSSIMGVGAYRIVGGEIRFDGHDITHMPVDQRAKLGIGLMSQRPPNLVGVTLKTMLKVTGHGKVDPRELASTLGMERFLGRDVNVGFSGGEIKRSELLQLAAQNPCMYMLDEPESGVDLESIEKVGNMVRHLLTTGMKCAGEREAHGKSALVITHTGQILDYIEADHGYVLCDGVITCQGNPRELLREIRAKGYEECVKCRLVRTG
ncbi:ATP-binding cassette domain-containing protein [Methanomassiliicoccus luminyensis]|uniref:ATP-binding cassette domain-containing protein n=1 Tax=Methanomassiliicoccus luminyensis TaxID=1080712 RepID=UPI0003772A33|nr:ATP-binding cassette domain-containing protein [Methanomassiliicoccus luminyensis]